MSSPATPTVNLIRTLINASEKAANIARRCRAHEQLLSLLVQEKSGEEANARFEHDFKTLADVLIQETVKHDVGQLFPSLREHIKGEESPNFTNTLGEFISISIGADANETANCLATVLNGQQDAAEVLAAEVHNDVSYCSEDLGEIPELPADFDYANVGIWIDPIDATAEYISGDSIFTNFPGITSTGLDCVTVLIGAYDRLTGEPIIGIVSQPFHNKVDDNLYHSLVYWGVCLPQLKLNNCATTRPTRCNLLAIFSSSESSDLLQKTLEIGYEFAFSAGAGHKALKVITWEVDLYLLSKSSTFKWDTCAPQAILRSLGGNIFNFKESVKRKYPVPVNYLENGDNENFKCNNGGIIAVREIVLIESLLEKLTVKE